MKNSVVFFISRKMKGGAIWSLIIFIIEIVNDSVSICSLKFYSVMSFTEISLQMPRLSIRAFWSEQACPLRIIGLMKKSEYTSSFRLKK